MIYDMDNVHDTWGILNQNQCSFWIVRNIYISELMEFERLNMCISALNSLRMTSMSLVVTF